MCSFTTQSRNPGVQPCPVWPTERGCRNSLRRTLGILFLLAEHIPCGSVLLVWTKYGSEYCSSFSPHYTGNQRWRVPTSNLTSEEFPRRSSTPNLDRFYNQAVFERNHKQTNVGSSWRCSIELLAAFVPTGWITLSLQTDFIAGSSKQGANFLASIGSIWVTAAYL